MIVTGIILLVIGVILYAIQSLLPPEGRKAASIGGIILVIVGIILIVLGAIGYAFLSIGGLIPLPLPS